MWDDITNPFSLLSQSSQACLATFAAIICITLLVKGLRKPRLLLPPGPRGLPIVGYLPFLGTDLHLTFKKLADVYGSVYKFHLGNKLCVVLTSPEVVKEVVRDKDMVFANRDASIALLISSYGGNDIAIQDYGPEWRKLRMIFAQKMLSSASLDASIALRREVVSKSVREIYSKRGTPVDLGEVGALTVINSVVIMIWGGSIQGGDGSGGGGSDLRELLGELMALMGTPNVSDFLPFLAKLDLQGIEARMKGVCSQLDKIFEDAIASKRKGSQSEHGRKDFLQYLLELQDSEDSESSISLTQIKAILMDLALGGTDTTSTMVEWTLSELLLHPEVLKTVQEELAEVVGLDNLVDESHLPKLHYLDAVVKEALRLHPPLPLLLPRRPIESTQVGGYTIPKDAKIFINVWAIQRDPSLWENPLEFRPDRFLNGTMKKLDYSGNDMQYLPFGSGRRKCPGLPLAERSLMYVLASFLHCFKWEIPKDAEIELGTKFGIIMRKKVSLVAIPSPRLSDLHLYA
ncbi:unnamed protein product [Rhodiola kirilowii]